MSGGRRVVDVVFFAVYVSMLGCTPSRSEQTGQAREASGTTVTFSVTLPVGESPSTVLAGVSTGKLSLDTGVTLVDASGSAIVANAGAGVNVGTNAVVGDKPSQTTGNVVSTGLVTLGNGAEVTGSVTTTVAPVVPGGAAIDGSVSIQPNLFLSNQNWTVTFPGTTLGDVALQPKATQTLAPGAYGNVSLGPKSTLILSAGNYTFVSLDIQPNAVIQCDTSASPLALYVQTSLSLQGTIAPSTGAPGLLLGYAGTSPVAIQSAFTGTLVAPSASVALHPNTQNTGAFFAQSLEVFPHASLVHVPFGAWGGSVVPLQGPSTLRMQDLSAIPPPTPPPALQTASDVPGFLQWAYQSRPSQVDAARAIIGAQIGNETIAAAIVNIVSNDFDIGRNLVCISILGELKTQAGFTYFANLLATPLPTPSAPSSPSFFPERDSLAEIQARALDGVALMMTPASDQLLLSVIGSTTHNVVRSRAIHHYLWIHGPAGRAQVSPLLSPDQVIFMDRFDVAGTTGTYDVRLATFLALHPEVVPPPFVIHAN